MNFSTRFIIVIVWLMSISASAFDVTRLCANKKKTILRDAVKTSQHINPTSSSTSDKSTPSCIGSASHYCIKNEEIATLHSYSNIIIYTGFTIHHPLSGFKSQPYSPPRQILDL